MGKKFTHKLINGPINKEKFLNKKYLGITEFIALSGDEKGLADAIADAGYENPLQKKDTDSEFMGRLKNAGEAVALFGGGKIAGKIASKTLVPAVNKTL